MLADHLRALVLLPLRPRRSMSALLDCGGIVAGLVIAAVSAFALRAALYGALAALGDEVGGGAVDIALLLLGLTVPSIGPVMTLAALVFLYVPATLLLVTLFDRVGSFGVAVRRDFGGLVVCTLSAFAVVALACALVAATLRVLGLGSIVALAALVVLTGLAFLALEVVALQTVCGANLGPAIGAVALSWLSFGLQGFVVFLASPWILYFGYRALQGDVGDILGGLGARRSFRRHMEAATLNPRDADAHYQLGLLHLQRRHVAEAKERFLKAVELDPGEIDAQYHLAKMARAEGRWEDAIRHLEAVLARDPRHSAHEAWREAGAVYLATGAYEHARTVLTRFVENRSYDPEGLYRLGLAQNSLGRVEEARELFSRAIEAARTAPDHRQRDVRGWEREARKALRG